jgi:hypothetical protein
MLERFSHSDILITYLLIGIFISIVVLKEINTYRFKSLFRLGWTNQYFKLLVTTPKSDFYFSTLLIIISSLCITLFYAMYSKISLNQVNKIELALLIKPFILILIYLLVKYVLQKIIGIIFQIEKMINQYLILKYSLVFYIGIALYIPILIIVYSNLEIEYLNIILTLLSCFYLIKILFFFFKLRSLLTNQLFYFILYICSFEIIPIFFLIWYLK